MSQYLEKIVLANTDMAIANTPSIKKQFTANYGLDEKKSIVIHNGFDKKDFQDLKEYNYDKFPIPYIGSMAYYRNPGGILTAIRELLDEDKNLENEIEVLFIGDGAGNYKKTINSMGLERVVKLVGRDN